MTYLSHLQCGYCQSDYDADRLQTLCFSCGKPLLARYDLKRARAKLRRESLESHDSTLWKFGELLPIRGLNNALSLGEGGTPLLHAVRLGKEMGMEHLYIKDEGLNPTGSFKARGLSVAVARARQLGVQEVVIPSAGNAAGAMSAYAAAAGMRARVFMPQDVPLPFRLECISYGATVTLVEGLITDCGSEARAYAETGGAFDMSTLKEPYRLEGKKTMGYELAQAFDWSVPDVIIYPTGGGTGLIGMWKAFDEMEALGWIGSTRPRMVVVQAEGCAPIVRAFECGEAFAEPWENAATIAAGLRVPAAVGDFLILQAVRESGGTAVAVSDEALLAGQRRLALSEGILGCPEGGATLATLEYLLENCWMAKDERVVLFNTGTGLKYPQTLRAKADDHGGMRGAHDTTRRSR